MNTYESYINQLIRRKKRYLEKLKTDFTACNLTQKDYTILFERTSAQINILYMVLSGHSSVINPYADLQGQPLKGKEKEFKEWMEEQTKKENLIY